MKKITTILSFCLLIFAAQTSYAQKSKATKKCDIPNKIRVAVFDGHGGAQTCIWEAVEAIRIDPAMSVRTVTTSEIAHNALDSIDALIIPGGGGSRQFINLGAENQKRIREFVNKGKGVVGICAGAYLLSSTPDYSCMYMNGGKAIDIEHDNRGRGIAKFSLTSEGKKLFPELANRDLSYVMYYEGPVYVPNTEDKIKYTTYAMMESDVHEEGNAPSNMTNNKPFFIANTYGKGRVFSSIAHPEATPGMQWMIPRMVRWTLDMPIVSYNKTAVNPDVFNKEILMSKDRLAKEEKCVSVFTKGTSAQKIEALDWMQSVNSWEAKRYIQSMLYDADPAVRLRAAKYVSEVGYLKYLDDMRAAVNDEKDAATKRQMKVYLNNLEAMIKH